MITHMQYGNGMPFSDPLLDKAMKEQILNDKSEGSTLSKIREVLIDNIDYEHRFYPLLFEGQFKYRINKYTTLPMFNNYIDRVNGLGISVHDTWATHITLESLKVSENSFKAVIHYHIQDHFGLDGSDVKDWLYKNFRIFEIWFLLQRWNKYGFKPFTTETNVRIEINGRREN